MADRAMTAHHAHEREAPRWAVPLFCVCVLVLAAGGLVAIVQRGSALQAATAVGPPRGGAGVASSDLAAVLTALLVVLLTARAMGWVFGRLRQPPVIGEMLAGLALGPSLLGRVAPAWSAALVPPAAVAGLGVLSQVGVLLFLFTVGLELDPRVVRQRAREVTAITHASLLLPFGCGAAAALWLYPRFATADVPFALFAVFCGLSLSVTAFPVLARILTDLGLQHTRVGVTGLACAAVGDIAAWCALASLVSAAHAQAARGVWTVLGVLVYLSVLVGVVRPLVRRWAERAEATGLTAPRTGTLVALLLASALATEWLGIHALFGAFAMGAVVPHDARIAREARERMHGPLTVLLLPAYFAFTGLRTQAGLLDGGAGWAICGALILLASAAKIGSSTLAGRVAGLPWREAVSLGVLMNTRGLMELVVLNIGLDLGLITPPLFAMLVLMAVLTTCGTAPLLHLLGVPRWAKWDAAGTSAAA